MKNKYLLSFAIAMLLFFKTNAQTFTDSNLPIVVLTTDLDGNGVPRPIPDDPKILGNMKIIKHPDGTRNFMTDINTAAFLNYSGRIGIEVRGSSSQSLPKKPYSLTTLIAGSTTTTTTQNVSILGMPSENDWVLNSLAFDKSLIRDYLAYNLSRQMGNYAVRTEYVEVVLNGNYIGLYMFTEKIKADSNRIDINKIAPADNTLPKLTGGYVTKADKTTGGDPVAWSMAVYGGGNTNYIHDFPKPVDVTPAQNTYIKSQFDGLQAAATANNTTLLNGYTTFIDVPTFVDFMVSNEYFANVDGYQLSTYFHKDRNGKLRAGPIWDFNLTMGNDLKPTYDRSFTNTWQFSNGDNEGSKFWTDLFNNPQYKCYFAKRWFELTATGKVLNQTSFNALADGVLTLISEAIPRESARWNRVTVANNITEVTDLKTWLTTRITWINANIGSPSACQNVATPPLVITRIHYNPVAGGGYSSSDQEFIQITNTGSTPVNCSGIYFSQLGTTYQFPYNSIIPPNSYIYLAASGVVFQATNGFAPFGLFSRNLSNTSQNIILADAFGNVIDQVNYADTAPWPTAADGGGSYMQLISTNLDNNLGTSWVAKSQSGLGSSCCN